MDVTVTDGAEAIPFTDGGPGLEEAQDTGSGPYALTVSDYGSLMVSSIPVGALCGAIFMIIGLAVLGVVKIFKKA